MVKKQYAEKKHNHWGSEIGITLIILLTVIVFGTIVIDLKEKVDLLEEQINSMPNYECHNESYEGFINKNELDKDGICWNYTYDEQEPKVMHCRYKDYLAECDIDSDKCYVKDTKEVCEII